MGGDISSASSRRAYAKWLEDYPRHTVTKTIADPLKSLWDVAVDDDDSLAEWRRLNGLGG